uniref:LysR family transcriptional regulator n=1 Tax=uncultured Bacillota bacterium TaxID=344338 RepID=A0A650EN67_9FIRM|nr:LysR family transcriptional regulator [uncultured Firmicutes bacterium]
MEIRVLRYFLTVARELSISGAANILHITQPTLSRQLMDLEQELGTQLIVRSSKKLSLTADGMLLKKRAEDIVNLADKTKSEFLAEDNTIGGDIYIGGGEMEAIRFIAKAAKELCEEYPSIHYHIYSGDKEDVAYKLDKGLLDFGIFVEPADITKYESLRLPGSDRWGLLMRKDSPLAKKDGIESKDLWEIPLIISRQTPFDKSMEKWIGRAFDKLNVVATYNLLYNAALMAEAGLGYLLCLDKLANTNKNDMLCFVPLHSDMEICLDIAWKKHQIFSKPAELFLKKLESINQSE